MAGDISEVASGAAATHQPAARDCLRIVSDGDGRAIGRAEEARAASRSPEGRADSPCLWGRGTGQSMESARPHGCVIPSIAAGPEDHTGRAETCNAELSSLPHIRMSRLFSGGVPVPHWRES
jgi:hypothetical protein